VARPFNRGRAQNCSMHCVR